MSFVDLLDCCQYFDQRVSIVPFLNKRSAFGPSCMLTCDIFDFHVLSRAFWCWSVNNKWWSWTAFDTCSCTVSANTFCCSALSASDWATFDFNVSPSAQLLSRLLIIVDWTIPAWPAMSELSVLGVLPQPATVSTHVSMRLDELFGFLIRWSSFGRILINVLGGLALEIVDPTEKAVLILTFIYEECSPCEKPSELIRATSGGLVGYLVSVAFASRAALSLI